MSSASKIQLLTLPDGGLVLCTQLSPLSANLSLLHGPERLNLEFHTQREKLSPIIFVILGCHLVGAWLPGVGGYVLDVGVGRPVRIVLSSFADEDENSMEQLNLEKKTQLGNLVPLGPRGSAREGESGPMLDSASGAVGILALSRTAVLARMEKPILNPANGLNRNNHVEAAALAGGHLRDAELRAQLLQRALQSRQGAAFTQPFIRELLICSIQDSMEQLNLVPDSVLALLPLSSLSPPVTFPIPGISAVFKNGDVILEALADPQAFSPSLAVPRMAYDRFANTAEPVIFNAPSFSASSSFSLSSSSLPAATLSSPVILSSSLDPSTPPSSGVGRLVAFLLGREDLTEQLNLAHGAQQELDAPSRTYACRLFGSLYEECLSDFFFRHISPKSKSKSVKYARCVRAIQLQQTCHLYAAICEACHRLNSSAARFRLLENYFSVLEDFSISLPAGFTCHFSSLGFRVLGWRLFLQYCERQVLPFFFFPLSFFCLPPLILLFLSGRCFI